VTEICGALRTAPTPESGDTGLTARDAAPQRTMVVSASHITPDSAARSDEHVASLTENPSATK
jgi:hypothetical protein